MENKLINDFEETTENLLQTLSSFTKEAFNKIPFEGSWTAGQVAEHLFKSESGIPRVLRGNSEETQRDPFEKTGIIETVFLDYTTKMKSPEFILPSNDFKNPEYFVKGFHATRKELRHLIASADLSKTFTDFPFPQIGTFTGWEWICFAVAHSKRHTRQMKNIAQAIKQSSAINA